MAVAFRAGATANHNSTAGTSSAAFTIPATAQVGDTALVVLGTNSSTATFTAPAGWTLASGPDTINTNLHAELFIKDIATGEPGATATFTTSVGARFPGVMSVFSGTSAADAVDALATVTTAGTTHTSPTVDTSVDNTGIAFFWALRVATAAPSPTLTLPTTQTADSLAQTNFTASPNFTVQASHRTTPGAAGTFGGNPATSSAAATSIMYTVALPPKATGTAPTASFTATPLSGTAPLAVTFADTSTGAPTSWAWNFGDGATATTQNPSHTYASSGTYTVSLTATNANGSSAAPTRTITVTDAAVGGGMSLFMASGNAWVPLNLYVLTP